MSLIVMSEIIELLVNTLTADDKYYIRNRENFLQRFQMQLSQIQMK